MAAVTRISGVGDQEGRRGWSPKVCLDAGNQFPVAEETGSHPGEPAASTCRESRRSTPAEHLGRRGSVRRVRGGPHAHQGAAEEVGKDKGAPGRRHGEGEDGGTLEATPCR
jgi:hypothetical protein